MTGVLTERRSEFDSKVGGSRRRGRAVLAATIAVAAAFAAFAAVLAVRLGDGPPNYEGTALLGDPVPALALPILGDDGESFSLARGKDDGALIVNFFNSWCIPCKQEEPALRAFYERHRGEADFAFAGIVRDDTVRAVSDWMRRQRVPWPVLLDPGARASVEFATAGQPETFAITGDGVVAAVHRGPATTDDLEALLAIARGERSVDGTVES